MPEAQPIQKATKRVDHGESSPVNFQRILGRIEREAGKVYQRCHIDDVDGACLPRELPRTKQVFPGWQVLHGPVAFRSRDDGAAKDTVARDRDTVWLWCLESDHALLEREHRAGMDFAAKRLSYGDSHGDEAVSFKGNARDAA